MNVWEAMILGLVEGVTEYLPVSSTGHLILTASLLDLDSAEAKRSVDAFMIVVQGGAILAVAGLYWPRIVQMLKGLVGRDRDGIALLFNLIIAFIPAAVFGLLLHSAIERWLFRPAPVVAALILGGVFMIALEAWRRGRFSTPRASTAEGEIESLTPARALLIGLFQCVALWPGASRSMMTITGGVIARLRPAAAAEFSFLLGLPTLGAATVYTLVKDFASSEDGGDMFSQLGFAPIFAGLVVATVSAALAVRWLVAFLNRHGLAGFGVYRILIGLAMTGLLLGQVVDFGPAPASDEIAPIEAESLDGPAGASP